MQAMGGVFLGLWFHRRSRREPHDVERTEGIARDAGNQCANSPFSMRAPLGWRGESPAFPVPTEAGLTMLAQWVRPRAVGAQEAARQRKRKARRRFAETLV
jgi:hypothetical protein